MPPASVDPRQLRRALDNLVENAIAALQNSQNYYFISDANFEVVSGNTLHIVIAIKPNSPALEADIKNEIETKIAPKIAGKTRFSSVLVQVNQ